MLRPFPLWNIFIFSFLDYNKNISLHSVSANFKNNLEIRDKDD